MSNCLKVRYSDRRGALHALRVIRKKSQSIGRKPPTGTYICSECKCWHLTSKTSNQVPPWEKRRARRRSASPIEVSGGGGCR